MVDYLVLDHLSNLKRATYNSARVSGHDDVILQTCAKYLWCPVLSHSLLLGTLRSNDTYGNENVKKNIRLNKENNNFARASHFSVQFFATFARLRRENAQFGALWRT